MISKEDVKKIASLSKLNLNEADLGKMSVELSNILQFVDKLGELDLKNVEATSHAVSMTNVFRDDIPINSQVQEDVLNRAPASEDNLFVVPKVL